LRGAKEATLERIDLLSQFYGDTRPSRLPERDLAVDVPTSPSALFARKRLRLDGISYCAPWRLTLVSDKRTA